MQPSTSTSFSATPTNYFYQSFNQPHPPIPHPTTLTNPSTNHTHQSLKRPHPPVPQPATPTSPSASHTHQFLNQPHPPVPQPATPTSPSASHTHQSLSQPHPPVPLMEGFHIVRLAKLRIEEHHWPAQSPLLLVQLHCSTRWMRIRQIQFLNKRCYICSIMKAFQLNSLGLWEKTVNKSEICHQWSPSPG